MDTPAELLETIAARTESVKRWVESDATGGDTIISVHLSSLGEILESVDQLRELLNVPIPGMEDIADQ